MKISRNDRLKNARKWVKQNAVKVASFEVADAFLAFYNIQKTSCGGRNLYGTRYGKRGY